MALEFGLGIMLCNTVCLSKNFEFSIQSSDITVVSTKIILKILSQVQLITTFTLSQFTKMFNLKQLSLWKLHLIIRLPESLKIILIG